MFYQITMFRTMWYSFILPVLLSDAQSNGNTKYSTVPEIHPLGCSSSTIQKYECSWELGPTYQDTDYDVTQKVLYQPPTIIQKSNIVIEERTLLVKFRNRDYGNIGKQLIILNATNRVGSTIASIEYYPKQQAIPLAPSSLQVKRKFHDYMQLSWRKSKGVSLYEDLLLYKLQYKEATAVDWTEIRDLQRTKFELHNVDAFTEYELQVASKFETHENQSAGWSPWSTKILTTTDMTYPGSSKNLKIHTIQTNFTSIHVTWLPPIQRNGPISKYYVRYKFTDSTWSSKLSVTATWFDLNARCSTGHAYRVKIGVAAVNVAPDGREFIGTEEFAASYVCSSTNQFDVDQEDTDASSNADSSYTEMHTTVLIIVLCMIALCFLFILVIIVFYKRSKLHGKPKIEWRFMHLEAPNPPQTETEIFDELPRRRQKETLQETAVDDVLSLPHSSSCLATSECISESNDVIDEEKHSEHSYDESSDSKDPKQKNEIITDQWPVADDFSYVTNGF